MAANSIGVFQFDDLNNPFSRNGSPLLVRAENEIIQRPGVHGTGIRRLGVKGETFQMISVRYKASMLLAAELNKLYTDLTKSVAQNIRFQNLDFDSIGMLYAVLNVSDADMMPVRNLVGAIDGPLVSAIKLTVTWTLQPVTLDQLGGQLTNG